MVTRTNQLGKLMKLKNSQKRRAAFLVAAFMGIAVALYHPSAVNGKTVQQQADVVATVNALLQIRAEVVATITAIAIQTGDKAPVSTPRVKHPIRSRNRVCSGWKRQCWPTIFNSGTERKLCLAKNWYAKQ